MECIQENPFSADQMRLLNISSTDVQTDLTRIMEIVQLALEYSTEGDYNKREVVKLRNFHIKTNEKCL